jgi:LmeA-like phospholipid-binding
MYSLMFGGFAGSNEDRGSDWGENLLNTVASNTLRHLFTRSEAVDVKVRCNPSSKLLQGSIDSFQMKGRGLVIRRDFRTEEMSFETDAVSIDFGSVLKGQISLKQPTQAIAVVKLAEPDINHAFTAELVRKQLENLTLPALTNLSGGQPVSFSDVEMTLLANNRVKLFAKADLTNCVVPVSLSCTLAIAKRRRILFQNAQFEPDAVPEEVQDLSKILTDILAEILNEMVDLDRFNLDGVILRLNRLETQGKMLIFSGYAQIERIPRTG